MGVTIASRTRSGGARMVRTTWLLLGMGLVAAVLASQQRAHAVGDESAHAIQKSTPKDKPSEPPSFEIIPDEPESEPQPKAPTKPKPEGEKKPDKPDKKPAAKPSEKSRSKPDTARPKGKGKGPALLGPDKLLPADVCHACLGCGFIPLPARSPLIFVEGEKAPSVEACVPWQFCPQCQADRDPKELVDAETARLQSAPATNAEWEKRMGMKLVRVETRHLTLHCEMTNDVARKQGEAAEATVAYIQQKTRTVFMTPSRCNNYEFLYLWDKPTYLKAIEVCRNVDEFNKDADWHLYKDVASFNGQLTTVGNAFGGKQVPPEHMVISSTALRQISQATQGKAGDCLSIGFAYHCEFALKSKVLMSYVRYMLNDAKFSPDWAAEAKKLYSERKFPAWNDLFTVDLRDWTPPHHVAAFTVTSYLMQDPVKFAKTCLLIRTGAAPSAAIETMYAKPIAQLEQLCGRWVTTGR